jgi:hypothetical protein
MSESSGADRWLKVTMSRIAQDHFPGRAGPLGEIVRQLAERHETAWRSSSEGVFRPTRAMYALALRWELDRAGPECAYCKGRVEVPTDPPRSRLSGPMLALGPRVLPRDGGLNVPQNLALCHADCRPGR